ncbi:MAG: YihA family ribosome biogenesis GTP-binding protein, partial [Bacteroidales bacterium]|nr:YihA family ribosome biogenesis GTP-binding protein [Bacteroidales bacterium]
VIVFTKADKIGKTIADKNLAAYRKTLLTWWEELPLMFISSAETKQGTQEILDYIEQNNEIFEQHKDLIQP